MKRRNGFVSNSSSSSFIVSIPESFNIDDHLDMIIRLTLEEDIDGDIYGDLSEDPSSEITEEIVDMFNTKCRRYFESSIVNLQLGDNDVWRDDDSYAHYFALYKTLDHFDFVLGAVDTGPDSGNISGIPFKKLMEKVIKMSGADPRSITEKFNENNNSGK